MNELDALHVRFTFTLSVFFHCVDNAIASLALVHISKSIDAGGTARSFLVFSNGFNAPLSLLLPRVRALSQSMFSITCSAAASSQLFAGQIVPGLFVHYSQDVVRIFETLILTQLIMKIEIP